MNFLRNVDELGHNLCVMQAHIFMKSIDKNIPSLIFIKSFMLSIQSRDLDKLNIYKSDINQCDIFIEISSKIKTTRGKLLSYYHIHYIGYFYRMFSYLTNLSSKEIYYLVSPSYLVDNYDVLHSLPINEAIKEVIENKNIKVLTKEDIFYKEYKLKVGKV